MESYPCALPHYVLYYNSVNSNWYIVFAISFDLVKLIVIHMLSKYIGQDFSEHKTTGQHTHTNACVQIVYTCMLRMLNIALTRICVCDVRNVLNVLTCTSFAVYVCVCILVCVRSVALIYLVNLLPHSREHAHKHIHNTHTLTNLVLLPKLWMLAIVRRLSRCSGSTSNWVCVYVCVQVS